jgi:hypothetical protein
MTRPGPVPRLVARVRDADRGRAISAGKALRKAVREALGPVDRRSLAVRALAARASAVEPGKETAESDSPCEPDDGRATGTGTGE